MRDHERPDFSETERFKELSPEDQANYLESKRIKGVLWRQANDPWPDVMPADRRLKLPDPELGARFYDRAKGCVLGSAIGDALGAPFEFGPPGAFTAKFPQPGQTNEMIGGGPWRAGEFTDDTQMAILEAEAFIEAGDVDPALERSFDNFKQWVGSGPKDVGISTRAVLTDPRGFHGAADHYYDKNSQGAAGNGSLMRASFVAARWCFANEMGTVEVARQFSSVTHGDPAAGEGRALLQVLIRSAHLENGIFDSDRQKRLVGLLKPEHQKQYLALISDNPPMDLPNGTVWGCLRDALLAVRRTDNFEDCMRMACDVGDDVDTVAAVAGMIAGSIYGTDGIPERWIEALNGDVLGVRYDADKLLALWDEMLNVPSPPK